MRVGVQAAAAVIVSSAVATIVLFGSLKDSNAQTNTRYLPEYTADIAIEPFDAKIGGSSLDDTVDAHRSAGNPTSTAEARTRAQ